MLEQKKDTYIYNNNAQCYIRQAYEMVHTLIYIYQTETETFVFILYVWMALFLMKSDDDAKRKTEKKAIGRVSDKETKFRFCKCKGNRITTIFTGIK